MHSSTIRPGTRTRAVLLLGTLVVLSVSCATRPALTSTPVALTPIVPTSTATLPPATPQVLLVAPEGTDARIAAQSEAALQDLATGAGAEFVRLDAMPDGGDPTAIELLVALPPDPGLQVWAESHPGIQTASLGIPGVQATENVSVLAPEGVRYDQLGFALGYLAAMVTPEYRLGALALEPTAESLSLARGFVAGGTYFCGLCRPVHPPYEGYPVLFDSPGVELSSSGVKALLVAPPPSSLAELGMDAASSVAFLGPASAFSDEAPAWIASADFDVAGALDALWAQAQTGEGGMVMPLRIRFHAVDPARVSEGRLQRAEALLGDLVDGRIDTGIDPLTGDLR